MKYLAIFIFFLAFLGVVLFKDIVPLYFFSDDFVWLLEAKRHTIDEIPKYLYQSEGFFYRPTTKLYFWTMWQLVGTEPYWYHLVNVLLHAGISLCVYFFTFLFIKSCKVMTGRPFAQHLVSMGAGLLFYVHPAHLENIIWPSAITELIPALCLLLVLICSLHYFQTKSAAPALLIFPLFLIGLGGHEYMIVLPILVFVTHVFYLKHQRINQIFSAHTWFYVALVLTDLMYLGVRAYSQAHWSGGDYSYNLIRLPFNIAGNLIGYTGILVFGIPFVDWYFRLRDFFRGNLILAGVLIFIILTVFFILRKYLLALKTKRLFSVFVYFSLFFFITLLPFLGLGGLAERYIYIASAGPIIFVSILLFFIAQFLEDYTEAVSYFTSYILIMGVIVVYYSYALIQNQVSWKIASSLTSSLMREFRTNCASFERDVTLVRRSPLNRYERAWVFQVGYEEGANVYCDKNIRILRK